MNWIKILPFFTLYNQQNITNYIYLNENKPVSQLCPVCTSKQFPWTHCELPQPLISVMRFYVLCFHLSQTFWKYPYLYKRGPKTTVDHWKSSVKLKSNQLVGYQIIIYIETKIVVMLILFSLNTYIFIPY